MQISLYYVALVMIVSGVGVGGCDRESGGRGGNDGDNGGEVRLLRLRWLLGNYASLLLIAYTNHSTKYLN